MKAIISSQYGILSRGRHSARRLLNGSVAAWAEKDDGGRLILDTPGAWHLHCTDGFNRTAKAVLTLRADGTYRMTGDTKRFTVLSVIFEKTEKTG